MQKSALNRKHFTGNNVSLWLSFWKVLPEGPKKKVFSIFTNCTDAPRFSLHQEGGGYVGCCYPDRAESCFNRMKRRAAAWGEVSRFVKRVVLLFHSHSREPKWGTVLLPSRTVWRVLFACLTWWLLSVFFVCVCVFFKQHIYSVGQV